MRLAVKSQFLWLITLLEAQIAYTNGHLVSALFLTDSSILSDGQFTAMSILKFTVLPLVLKLETQLVFNTGLDLFRHGSK